LNARASAASGDAEAVLSSVSVENLSAAREDIFGTCDHPLSPLHLLAVSDGVTDTGVYWAFVFSFDSRLSVGHLI
jgi:hypothetical protein